MTKTGTNEEITESMVNPAGTAEMDILIDTSKMPATFSITQQRGVIVDDAGNQEFFWMKLTLPFTLSGAIAPSDEMLQKTVRERLVVPLGRIILDAVATHEQLMAPAVQVEEYQDNPNGHYDEEIF